MARERTTSRRLEVEAGVEYSYLDLLKHARKHIDRKYGSVSLFLSSDKFLKAGFKDTPQERAKIATYLSLPRGDNDVSVKSFPTLKKLYREFFNIKLKNDIRVTREQVVTADTHIKGI